MANTGSIRSTLASPVGYPAPVAPALTLPSSPVAPLRVRVYFADTDAMGVVYYGRYPQYLEMARIEALRQVGFEYKALVAQGVQSPVVELTVRYRQAAKFDDVLLVYAWASAVDRVRFSVGYDIRRESDGAQVVTAHSTHACVDAHTLRPVRLPPTVVEALRRLQPEVTA